MSCGSYQASVCQSYNNNLFYQVGTLDSVRFSLSNSDLIMAYTGTGGYKFFIYFKPF